MNHKAHEDHEGALEFIVVFVVQKSALPGQDGVPAFAGMSGVG